MFLLIKQIFCSEMHANIFYSAWKKKLTSSFVVLQSCQTIVWICKVFCKFLPFTGENCTRELNKVEFVLDGKRIYVIKHICIPPPWEKERVKRVKKE